MNISEKLNLNFIAKEMNVRNSVLFFMRRGLEPRTKSNVVYRQVTEFKLKHYLLAKAQELEVKGIEAVNDDNTKWFKKNNVFKPDTLRKIKDYLIKTDDERQEAEAQLRAFIEQIKKEASNGTNG